MPKNPERRRKNRSITVKRHIDGGVETVEGPLPIVITVNGSAAPCRPRNAKLVMKYKRALGAQEKLPLPPAIRKAYRHCHTPSCMKSART